MIKANVKSCKLVYNSQNAHFRLSLLPSRNVKILMIFLLLRCFIDFKLFKIKNLHNLMIFCFLDLKNSLTFQSKF